MRRDKIVIASGHSSQRSILSGLVESGCSVRVLQSGLGAVGVIEDNELIHKYTIEAYHEVVKDKAVLESIDVLSTHFLIAGIHIGLQKLLVYAKNKIFNEYVKALGFYKYGEHIFNTYNCVGIFLNTDKPEPFAVLSVLANSYGIPVFCSYNGTFSSLRMKISEPTFVNSDFYYLCGEYEADWIKERDLSTSYLVSGAAHWDSYYSGKVERKDNVVLYCPLPAQDSFSDSETGEFCSILQVCASWYRNALPSYGDDLFFAAFREYLDYNPAAELWVAPRPYVAPIHYQVLLDKYNITNFVVLDGFNFSEHVRQASCLVSWVSTTVVDGVITRTPTVLIYGTEYFGDHFKGEGAYLETKADLSAIIENLRMVNTKNTMEDLVDKCNQKAWYYNYDDDGKATERILTHLLPILGRK